MSEVKWKEQEGEKLNMWLPQEKNDELIGVVIEMKAGQYGSQYLVKQKDDTELWTPSHKVLQNRMVDVSTGMTIKIVFDGELPPKQRGDNPTKMYKVFVAE